MGEEEVMGALDAELSAATAKALGEISVKSLYVIQWETSLTWAGRALAAYEMYTHHRDPHWLSDASEYAHEALEHAALAGPHIYGPVYAYLHETMTAAAAVPPLGV